VYAHNARKTAAWAGKTLLLKSSGPAEIVSPEAAEIASPEAAEIVSPEAAEIASPEAAEIVSPEAAEIASPEAPLNRCGLGAQCLRTEYM
jgi:hypothetical protein